MAGFSAQALTRLKSKCYAVLSSHFGTWGKIHFQNSLLPVGRIQLHAIMGLRALLARSHSQILETTCFFNCVAPLYLQASDGTMFSCLKSLTCLLGPAKGNSLLLKARGLPWWSSG